MRMVPGIGLKGRYPLFLTSGRLCTRSGSVNVCRVRGLWPLAGTTPRPGLSHQPSRPQEAEEALVAQEPTAALEDGGLSTAALPMLTQKGLPEVGAESQGYGTPRPFPSLRAGAWDGLPWTGPEPAPLRAGEVSGGFLANHAFLVSTSPLSGKFFPISSHGG